MTRFASASRCVRRRRRRAAATAGTPSLGIK